ncbi:MAG: hypothetical protein ACI97A_003300 [Planctomycetota bacterium]|jgi:hypothetical protein
MKWFLLSGFVLILCAGSTVQAQPQSLNVTLKDRLQSFPATFKNTTAVGVGDVNGDGHHDFALVFQSMFLPSSNPFDLGSLVIYSGIDKSVLHTMSGLIPAGVSATFGVCSVGDYNGDGFDDIAVSFPTAGTSGEIRFLSGFDLSVLLNVAGPSGTESGNFLARLDDTNNDGVGDVGFSCQSLANPSLNKLRVISGATGATIIDITDSSNDFAVGENFVSVGDVNGDGTSDLLIGEPFWSNDPSFILLGRARVFSGVDGSVLHTYIGSPITGALLGGRVAGLGDINNDGAADFAFSKGNEISIRSGLSGALITTLTHPNRWTAGYILASVGDLDGDGINDIAYEISDQNPFYLSSTDNHQEIRFISGASFSVIGKIPAPDGAADKGMRLTKIGDTNGDGTEDLLLTSIMKSPSFTQQNPQPPEFPDPQVLVYETGISPFEKISSNSGNTPALDYEWLPNDGISNSLRGTLKANGATPLASGLIVASLAPIDLPVHGIDLLVAVDSINLLRLATLGANSSGEFIVANISRASFPFLAGSKIYSQIFEITPTLRASNAMKIIAIP